MVYSVLNMFGLSAISSGILCGRWRKSNINVNQVLNMLYFIYIYTHTLYFTLFVFLYKTLTVCGKHTY